MRPDPESDPFGAERLQKLIAAAGPKTCCGKAGCV